LNFVRATSSIGALRSVAVTCTGAGNGPHFLAGTATSAIAFGTATAVPSRPGWANARPVYRSGDLEVRSDRHVLGADLNRSEWPAPQVPHEIWLRHAPRRRPPDPSSTTRASSGEGLCQTGKVAYRSGRPWSKKEPGLRGREASGGRVGHAHAGLLFKLATPLAAASSAALMAAITASSAGAPVRWAATDCRK
jgi:hypothetical protein